MKFMQKYNKKIEDQMVAFYNNLQEKDKRHYAAVEAIKLGYGGIKYISSLLSCTRQSILISHELDDLRGEYSLYGDNIAYAVLITKDQGHDEL